MRLNPTGCLRGNSDRRLEPGDAGIAGRSTARSSPVSPRGDRDE